MKQILSIWNDHYLKCSIKLVINDIIHITGQVQMLLHVNFLSTKEFHQFSCRSSLRTTSLRTTDLDCSITEPIFSYKQIVKFEEKP